MTLGHPAGSRQIVLSCLTLTASPGRTVLVATRTEKLEPSAPQFYPVGCFVAAFPCTHDLGSRVGREFSHH